MARLLLELAGYIAANTHIHTHIPTPKGKTCPLSEPTGSLTSTAPNVSVTIVVKFPNGSKKTKTGTADSKGSFTWSFKQPPGKTKGKNHSAKVTVTVKRGSEPSKSASKQYKIT
jgi:hypothetical protein